MADPASLAITAAMMAAQMALTMTQKIKGPRLDDLNVSLADYGTPIPRIWGTRRINPQTIWAEKLREKKKTSKTKGGKYTEYKYYGTWAVLLCDHEIDAVTRIWMDKRLVYQRTQAGPTSLGSLFASASNNIKLTQDRNMRIYLGTETQEPDPRIESWCEDRYGANSCPAYRGSAYIVFENIPLETVGNRIPQVTVEVVNNKTDSFLYETKTAATASLSAHFTNPNGSWIVYHNNGQLEWWDVPTRTSVGSSSGSGFVSTSASETSLASDGTAYCCGTILIPLNYYLCSTSPLGEPVLTAIGNASGNAFFGVTRVLESGTLRKIYTSYEDGTGYVEGNVHHDYGQYSRDFCVTGDGEFWGLFQPSGSSNQFTIRNMISGDAATLTGLVTRSGPSDAQICHVSQEGHFFVRQDGKFYIIDDETLTITSSGAFSDDVQLPQQNPDQTTAWDPESFNEYSLVDGSPIRNLDHTSWAPGAFIGQARYDPLNHAIWARQSAGATIYIFFLDRVSPAGVTLQTVVDDVSEWIGLSGQDTTALTQTVYGYSVTQGQAKDMIQPLLDVHDVDARPHDFSVQFKNRGSSPSGSIATTDFVRENGPRYAVTLKQDTDIPRRVTINFADKDKDQQTNTAIAQRPLDAVDSNREETLDLTTYADSVDGAQQKADRYFRRAWNSREQVKLSTTLQKLGLEPGDVTTIELDGTNRNVRLDKMTVGRTAIECEFIRDETSFAAINTATTGAEMEGRDEEEIFIPSPAKGFIIDAPYVEDVDQLTNPSFYYLAGPYGNGDFAGAVLAEGDGVDYDEMVGAVESSSPATWGLATTALATANFCVWDRGNSVTINLQNGSLTSATEAEINADPALNLAALGADDRWEYIQFTTATLNANGTYTLSGFKRGRRGTEANVGNHATGDAFILLDNRYSEERGASDIGDALSFKIQALGRDIEQAEAIDITFGAECLKPYAPCSFRALKSPSTSDVALTWIRRTRIGGAWTSYSTIPLSEDSESYEIDIYSGSTFKRTLSSATQSATYTSAEQTTDGTTTGFTAKLYQLSATAGHGYVNSTTFAF